VTVTAAYAARRSPDRDADSSSPSGSTAGAQLHQRIGRRPGHPPPRRRVRRDDNVLDGEHQHEHADDGGDLVAHQGATRFARAS
jgi:hypothetical protein